MEAQAQPFIHIEDVYYSYQVESGKAIDADGVEYALKGVDLEIYEGEYIAVVGANGSGKSTLLRHLNALFIPTRGNVWVAGWNTRDSSRIRGIRSSVGMVFQVPDNQIVATIVEDDVAFGPENLGVPEGELRERVDWALDVVGLKGLEHYPTHSLSGGQKQLLAVASCLSMKPRCLLLDEATSMLDPGSRGRVLETVKKLHREGMTVVAATHSMEEATLSDRVVVLSGGRVEFAGSPREIFSRERELGRLKLEQPVPTRIAGRVGKAIPGFPTNLLTVGELVEAVYLYLKTEKRVR